MMMKIKYVIFFLLILISISLFYQKYIKMYDESIFYMEMEIYTEAIAVFTNIIKQNFHCHEAYVSLCQSYKKRNQYDLTLQHYTKAAKMSDEAFFLRRISKDALNDKEGPCGDLKKTTDLIIKKLLVK